jgi:hypothetical protein
MRTNIGGRIAARALIAAGIISAQACASGGGGVAPHRSETSSYLRGPELMPGERGITAGELRKAAGRSAFDALRQLRPQFLFASRGALGPDPSQGLAVYENGTYLGGVDELHAIPVELVFDIYRLSEMKAQLYFGAHCVCRGGVLVIRTRR